MVAGEVNDNHSHLGRQGRNNEVWIEVDTDSVFKAFTA